jgi:hypothetical protein
LTVYLARSAMEYGQRLSFGAMFSGTQVPSQRQAENGN